MKILVTGANGQLGKCLADVFQASEHDFVFADRALVDLSEPEHICQKLDNLKPDFVINAAAYTAVDKAEAEPELAQLINASSPEAIALWCSANKAGFIHVSTDYVFDGTATRPYVETDSVNPTSVYGKTKLAGEIAVLQAYPAAIIIRTAWVFSEYGSNFVKTMLRLGAQRDELKVVADQVGCPTYAGDIAAAIKDIVLKVADSGRDGGVYHFCGDKAVSWFEFAQQVFAAAKEHGVLLKDVVVQPIPTSEYPTPARRPAFSVLSTAKMLDSFGVLPSDWQNALSHVVSGVRP